MEVAGLGEAGDSGRLDRHRGALPVGAVEDQGAGGGGGELVEQAPRREVAVEVGIGGVHRAGEHAVPLPLAPVAQVHEEHVAGVESRPDLIAVQRPAPRRHVVLREPDRQVRGDRDIHHLRVGEVQAVHQVHVLVDRLDLEARVAHLLLADGADGVALVVVRREDQGLVGEAKQAVEEGVVLVHGVAVLEVGAPRPPDEQRVSGEDAIAEQEAVGVVGVPGGVEHLRLMPSTSMRSPSATRIETTSTALRSPITVMHRQRSRSAPSPVMWSACTWVSAAFTSLRSSSSRSVR